MIITEEDLSNFKEKYEKFILLKQEDCFTSFEKWIIENPRTLCKISVRDFYIINALLFKNLSINCWI